MTHKCEKHNKRRFNFNGKFGFIGQAWNYFCEPYHPSLVSRSSLYLSRRDFIRLSAITAAGALLSACGNNANDGNETKSYPPVVRQKPTPTAALNELGNYIRSPSTNMFAAYADYRSITTIGEFNYLDDTRFTERQKQLFLRALYDNYTSTVKLNRIELYETAKKNGLLIGLSGCSDSRSTYPFEFPVVVQGRHLLEQGVAVEVARIGAQPAVFEKGVVMSVFAPHMTEACTIDGCGALGGIKKLITQGKQGEEALKHHGVTEDTINILKGMMEKGAKYNPIDWAEIGARIQAEINLHANGANHFVAYGVTGHADDSITGFQYVIDSYGHKYDITKKEFAVLKSFTDFIDQQHAVWQTVAQGQIPGINVVSASKKHPVSTMFGKLSQEKGGIFKATDDRNPVVFTMKKAQELVANINYSLGALQQDGDMIYLIADTEEDLTKLRIALLTDKKNQDPLLAFLRRGGAIVEVIPDANGTFKGGVTIRTLDNLAGEMNLLKGSSTSTHVIDDKAISRATQAVRAKQMDEFISSLESERALKIIAAAKQLQPVGKVLWTLALKAANILTVFDVEQYLEDRLLKKTLNWELEPRFIKIKNGKTEYYNTQKELEQAREEQQGANPYLDQVEIEFTQAEMVKQYAGLMRLYMEQGPGGAKQQPPLSKIKTTDDLLKFGKTISFPVPGFQNPSTNLKVFTMPERHIITDIIVQPEINAQGQVSFDDRLKTQWMQMTDINGLPLFGSIRDQRPKIVRTVVEGQNDLVHIWQMIPVIKPPYPAEPDPRNSGYIMKYLKSEKVQPKPIPIR